MRLPLLIMLVVLLITMSYNIYRIWQMLPFSFLWKSVAMLVPVFAIASFVLYASGVIDKLPMSIATLSYEISTTTLIAILYLTLIFGVLDLGRLLHIVPSSWLHNNAISSGVLSVFMLVLFVAGNIKYKNKVRVPLTLHTNKVLEKPLKIVMVSDLHVGYHNNKKELERWIEMINSENPNLVLIAGDIVDGNMRPVWQENMAESFRKLKAPVYACLGNHEYLATDNESKRFYQAANITLLKDSVAQVLGLNIIGRDDKTNPYRRSLAQLVDSLDKSKYTIVLDHQPYNLEFAEQSGVDFQLSGHTHRGQVWPLSWIVDSMYEQAHGSLTKGKTHYYVSSGLGIWGGKYRIGTQSEYVVATLSNP